MSCSLSRVGGADVRDLVNVKAGDTPAWSALESGESDECWEYSPPSAACGVRETGMQLSDRQPTMFVIKVLLTNKKNEVLRL